MCIPLNSLVVSVIGKLRNQDHQVSKLEEPARASVLLLLKLRLRCLFAR